jgi:hypothetical protein
VSNHLPMAKRAAILEMHADGAGVREIARATGVDRSSVRTCIDRIVEDRRQLIRLYYAISAALPRDLDLDEITNLGGALCWSCPIHPDAILEDFDEENGSGCLICAKGSKERAREGLKRHHARRKAEGRPIAPPRKMKRLAALLASVPSEQRALAANTVARARLKGSVVEQNEPIAEAPAARNLVDLPASRPAPAPRSKPLPNAVRNAKHVPAKRVDRVPKAVEQRLHVPEATTTPLELGSVVPGPPPKGRKHGVTTIEIKGHQANKENRQRVCSACLGPADVDLGKFRRLAADPCPRCGKPTTAGSIVRERKEPKPDRVVSKAEVTPYSFGR